MISHILRWLSLLFSSSSISKSIINQLIIDLIKSLENIFSKLGRSSYEQIEFSLKNSQSLYQSLGTLSNSLLMVDFNLLIDFCKECFILIKSSHSQTSLIASMCLSRLLFKVSSLNSEASIKLAPKLRETISFSFNLSCDENCRILSSVMNDLFTIELLSKFEPKEIDLMINGTIRGYQYSGEEMKHNNLLFLSKLSIVAHKDYFTNYNRVWEILISNKFEGLIINAITTLIKINSSFEKINIPLLSKFLYLTTLDDVIIPKRSIKLLKLLFKVDKFENIFEKLLKFLDIEKFNEFRIIFIQKINKSNVNITLLDTLYQLYIIGPKEQQFEDFLFNLILSIIDDSENVLRKYSSQLIPKLIKFKNIPENKNYECSYCSKNDHNIRNCNYLFK